MNHVAENQETDFVTRTYRVTLFVAVFVLFVLASYNQFWALAPVGGGVLLGLVLLRALEWAVRGVFTPERAREARRSKRLPKPKSTLIVAALVKYPLVAALLWAVTRVGDERTVVAFAGGFVLVQTVIALRGMGRFLVERLAETDTTKSSRFLAGKR
jgi:hypothetical protein